MIFRSVGNKSYKDSTKQQGNVLVEQYILETSCFQYTENIQTKVSDFLIEETSSSGTPGGVNVNTLSLGAR